MVWTLFHSNEKGEAMQVGSWSDAIVESVADDVSFMDIHKDIDDLIQWIKEFLPNPIRDALEQGE
jgi:hypothetical protein